MNKRTTAFEVIDGGRLTAAHAALAHARKREAVVGARRRGDRIQAIAKRERIGYNEVLALVEEHAGLQEVAAKERAFRDGVLAERFGIVPPPPAVRRAA